VSREAREKEGRGRGSCRAVRRERVDGIGEDEQQDGVGRIGILMSSKIAAPRNRCERLESGEIRQKDQG